MADKFIMHEGQLCRRVESFEPVDVRQLELKVEQDTETRNRLQTEHDNLKKALGDKATELEDAEAALEDSKSDVKVASDVVAVLRDNATGDDTQTAEDGTSGEVSYLSAEPVL